MNRAVAVSLDGAFLIDRFTQKVKNTSEDGLSNGDLYRRTSIGDLHPAFHSVGRTQRHRADLPTTEVLLHLSGQGIGFTFDIKFELQGIVDFR